MGRNRHDSILFQEVSREVAPVDTACVETECVWTVILESTQRVMSIDDEFVTVVALPPEGIAGRTIGSLRMVPPVPVPPTTV